MPACEKCWYDAGLRAMTDRSKRQVEHYHDLLKEREDNPCGQEGSTREDVGSCPSCGAQCHVVGIGEHERIQCGNHECVWFAYLLLPWVWKRFKKQGCHVCGAR